MDGARLQDVFAVNFHEVVHSVQAVETEVAKLQLRGRTEWTSITLPASRQKVERSLVGAVIEQGLSKALAARQFRVSPKAVKKWVTRFHNDELAGLLDRPSRPQSLPEKIGHSWHRTRPMLGWQRGFEL